MSFRPSRVSILPLLCAALLTLLCLLWIRTRWHTTILGFFTPSGHLQAIASDRDGLLLFLSDVPFGPEAAGSADAMTVSSDDFAAAHDLVYNPAFARLPGHWQFAGFRYARDQLTPTPTIAWHFRAITIPYWVLIVLLSILPLQRLQRWIIRRRRLRRGQCPACGYDLRGSGQRCPECGRAKQSTTGDAIAMVGNQRNGSFTPRASMLSRLLIFLIVIAASLAALHQGGRIEGRIRADDQHAELLNQKLSKIELADGSLGDVMRALRESSPVPILNDGRSVSPVSMLDRGELGMYVHLQDVSLSAALTALSRLSDPPFDFSVANGSVRIRKSDLELRCYLVSRLLRKLAREPHHISIPNDYVRTQPSSDLVPPGEYLERIVSEVDPQDSGAELVFGDRLIVAQPAGAQAAIRTLLQTMTSAEGEMTAIQAANGEPVDDAALHRRIAEININAANLAQALDAFEQKTHANIVVDWKALADGGIPRNQPIQLRLWNVTLGKALECVFAASGGADAVCISATDGIIMVGSSQRPPPGEIRIYDVHDVVEKLLPFERAKAKKGGMIARELQLPHPFSMTDVIESVERLIEDEVDPDSWMDNGGAIGSIRDLGGRLIIDQSPRNHERIAALIRTLRAGGSKEGMRIQDAPQTQPSGGPHP